MKNKIYGMADKAWQFVVGCDPSMLCAPRCWARRTVARVVECQKEVAPDRSKFYQIALSPDGQKWSGQAYLDPAHLNDPLHWRKPALIASGFHGDWARLCTDDITKVMGVALSALRDGHRFMFLTKQPQWLVSSLRIAMNRFYGYHWGPPGGLSIGCSVMNQTEADRCAESMFILAHTGWHTHVWYEPAIGPVDWTGWEFLKLIIVGGESGTKARPFNLQWAHDTFEWCDKNKVKAWMKQLGADPRLPSGLGRDAIANFMNDPKGEVWENLPGGLRVRELPDELILSAGSAATPSEALR